MANTIQMKYSTNGDNPSNGDLATGELGIDIQHRKLWFGDDSGTPVPTTFQFGPDDLAANAVTTAKILDDNVTAAKLADTAVTAGSYTLSSITVDAQGRITAASSGSASGGASLSGSTDNTIATVTGSNALQGESNLTFDGSTLAVTGALTVSGTSSLNGSAHLGDNDYLYFGADNDYSLGYVSGNYLAFSQSVDSSPFGIVFKADSGGDDAGDEWLMNLANAGVMSWGNDIASAGTYVTHFSCTPNATVANSTFAMAGHATVGHDLTVSGDLAVTGSYGLAASDIPNLAASKITSGTLAVARGGTALTSLSTLLNSNVTPTSLGLVIGTNVQAWDAQLDTLAGASSTNATAVTNLTGTNSGDVSLASVSGNYLTLSGQSITAGIVPVSLGGTGKNAGYNYSEWDTAYDNSVTGISDSGSSTITLTLTQQDSGTLTTSFSNPQGTVTSVDDGNGLTGGAITTSGSLAVGAGTGITVNTNDVAVTAAQTGITSIINSSFTDIGTAADQEYIKFDTANEINTMINNTERLSVTASGANVTGTFSSSGAISGSNLSGTNTGDQTINTADIADVSVTQTELAELETLGSTSISSANWIALSNLSGTNTGDGGGGSGTTINNNADNYIITGSGTADTLEAEGTFTFDGTDAALTSRSAYITLGSSHPAAAPAYKLYDGTDLKTGTHQDISVATAWMYDAVAGAVVEIAATNVQVSGGIIVGYN